VRYTHVPPVATVERSDDDDEAVAAAACLTTGLGGGGTTTTAFFTGATFTGLGGGGGVGATTLAAGAGFTAGAGFGAGGDGFGGGAVFNASFGISRGTCFGLGACLGTAGGAAFLGATTGSAVLPNNLASKSSMAKSRVVVERDDPTKDRVVGATVNAETVDDESAAKTAN
jgi:hypothetical protein